MSAESSNPRAGVVVRKGEVAPKDGILLTRNELAGVITELQQQADEAEAKLESLRREHKLVTDTADAKCDARVGAEVAKEKACQGARTKEATIYESALKRANDVPFWKSPTLMTILGLGAGAAVCAIAR